MKNFNIKFLAALLSFSAGILAFYLISDIRPFSETSDSIALPSETSFRAKELSNKVEIRLVKFVQGELAVETEFEITNNTAENVYYRSFSKDSYPFPTLKRGGKIVKDNRGRCGTGITEQTLSPRETVFFRVPKSEITYEPTKDSWRETDEPTQVGFPFEVGNKPFVRIEGKKPEIFWSEEIKFPR